MRLVLPMAVVSEYMQISRTGHKQVFVMITSAKIMTITREKRFNDTRGPRFAATGII